MRLLKNQPTTKPISPVSAAQLADFLALTLTPADEPLLNLFLETATDVCIRTTSHELLQRTYNATFTNALTVQQGLFGISDQGLRISKSIAIPRWPATVLAVEFDGVPTTKYRLFAETKPLTLQAEMVGEYKVTYQAGYATAPEIPATLTLGIMQLAGYLYDKRGACEITDAIRNSGAAASWSSQTMLVGSL